MGWDLEFAKFKGLLKKELRRTMYEKFLDLSVTDVTYIIRNSSFCWNNRREGVLLLHDIEEYRGESVFVWMFALHKLGKRRKPTRVPKW